jgi:SWI/SNF-related matrix-associated actin-dependent regulator of chromatin subfamily A member 5
MAPGRPSTSDSGPPTQATSAAASMKDEMETSDDEPQYGRSAEKDEDDSMGDGNDTNDYTDSESNLNTTASSVAGDSRHPLDGRSKRNQQTQLRKTVFGKKHSNLDREKVRRQLND